MYTKQINLLLFIWLFYTPTVLFSQGWEILSNGIKNDEGKSLLQTPDGGYFIVGSTDSFSPDPWTDIYVVKITPEGRIENAATFGLPEGDYGCAITATPDQQSLIAGTLNTTPDPSLFLAEFRTSGDALWAKQHFLPAGSFGLEINQLTLLSTNDYLLIGGLHQSPNSNIYLTKIDPQGDTLWTKTYGELNDYDIGKSFFEKDDHTFLSFASKNDAQSRILHLNANGEVLLDSILTSSVNIIPLQMLSMPDQEFVIMGRALDGTGIDMGFYLAKYTSDLTLEWEKVVSGSFPETTAVTACLASNGGFLLAGSYFDGDHPNILTIKTDVLGNEQWTRIYGGLDWDMVEDVIPTADGGYALTGNSRSFSAQPDYSDIYFIKTDSLGFSFTNQIRGTIFYDTLENCVFDPIELPLEGWKVIVEGANQTYYGRTDEFGQYSVTTDTGDYLVQVIRPNAYWSPCETLQGASFSNFHDTTTVDFPVQALYDCSILDVSISTPLLRRCYSNAYYLNYCNEGTVTAENATVEMDFDEFLHIDSAQIGWIEQVGNTYTFPLGDVLVGDCHTFKIYTTLDCDSTVLGQAHCVEAHAFPDSICLPPNTFWNGVSIEVDGVCEGDSIVFIIKNVGTGNMTTPLNYIVIEDHIIHRTGNFQLLGGDSLKIKEEATGATYRLEAEQPPFHPSGTVNASATVEGCNGTSATFSIGFVNQYSANDDSPFTDIDCEANVGSWDPNDKKAYPEGIGNQHFIDANTQIEYKIRFQNTGTDTAFRVVIRDTLSSLLDPASIQVGTSSHPYTWEILNGSVLKFSFEDILLPDSNVNEPASHGFVRFKIAQQPDNLPGSIIENNAGIYFDFNAPVITNTTFHTIATPISFATENITLCEGETVAGVPIYMDTTWVDTLHFASFDSVTLMNFQVFDTLEISLDTMLTLGSIFNGIEILTDTTLIFSGTSIHGCDSLTTIQIQLLTTSSEVSNPNQFNLKIHPNPTAEELWIEFDSAEGELVTLALFDLMGNHLKHWELEENQSLYSRSFQLNIKELESGTYFLLLRIGNSFKAIKFTKI